MYKRIIQLIRRLPFPILIGVKIFIRGLQIAILLYDKVLSFVESSRNPKVIQLSGNILISSRKQIFRNTLIIFQDVLKYMKIDPKIEKVMLTTSSAIFDPVRVQQWLQDLPNHPYMFAKKLSLNSGQILSGFLLVFTPKGLQWICNQKRIDGSINNDVFLTELIYREKREHQEIDYKVINELVNSCLFCEADFCIYKIEYKIDKLYEINIFNSIYENLCAKHR
jgi:hypothetical protein